MNVSASFDRAYKKPPITIMDSWHVMVLIISLAFTQTSYATVTGPGAAWGFCRKITLSAATPLADFQVKVTLTTGQCANMNANGNDLRLYDINKNVCNYWIEAWNNAGISTIWVKAVSNGINAPFMYYGDAAASGRISPNTFSINNGANRLTPTRIDQRLFRVLLPNTPISSAISSAGESHSMM